MEKIRRKTSLQKQNLYGNISVLSPDNVLMFYSNQRRLNFYIKNNLVDCIDDKTYRLKFKPNGLGHAEDFEKFRLRKNVCVVNGTTDNLTKHHIVPKIFRKLTPDRYTSNSTLIVLVNRFDHDKYTIEEQIFLDVLAERFGSRSVNEVYLENKDNIYLKKVAGTLLRHQEKITDDFRHLTLSRLFTKLSGLTVTDENLNLIANKKLVSPINIFAKELFDKITDFDEFERIWVNHFIEVMKPKFLPDDLVEKFLDQQS